jgi:hypothetical protein
MAIQIQNPKVASSSKIKRIGVKLPFTRSDGGIFEQSVSTQDQLLSNFINLIKSQTIHKVLLTRPTEYVRHSIIGVRKNS